MFDFSKLTKPLERLIEEHGSATILGKHLSLIKEQLGIAQQEISKLEKKNALLSQKVDELEKFISENIVPEDFIKHRGVLFHSVDGVVSLTDVYCPKCKIVMSSLAGEMPFKCSQCGFKAPFNGRELASVTANIDMG